MSPRDRWCLGAAVATLCFALAIAAQTSPQVTTNLTVSGNVAQPLTLTIDDLRAYPSHQIDYRPRAGVPARDPTESIRHYKGCLLRDVLTAARPIENKARDLRKSYVVATASDGYEVVFSWAELFISSIGDNVFVVYERDGVPLGEDEGRIALIVTSDTRPVRHIKWLQALKLRVA